MYENIRRSVVIAADVTGTWTLGSAVTSADELPAHQVAQAENAADAADPRPEDEADYLFGPLLASPRSRSRSRSGSRSRSRSGSQSQSQSGSRSRPSLPSTGPSSVRRPTARSPSRAESWAGYRRSRTG
ncbi:hypothetical protein ACIOKD_04465 [Streptomyces sp. NPDC087844]|uniref:hypothetical protein n=1 Tax=Streptomyces sp. NPDC087844 TaxID=3365805 RepID=UPI0037F52961